MTSLEAVAVLFILANVWLMVKENIWGWPAGIAGVILYAVVNYRAHLYSNAGLQIVYLILSIHGWYEWLHGGAGRSELQITRASRRVWLYCSLAGVAGTFVLLGFLRLTTDAAFPIWDASTTSFSLVAQWMLNEKITENWLWWLVIDIVYVPIYIFGKLPLTAALYALFCVLSVKGYVDWKRSVRPGAAAVVA